METGTQIKISKEDARHFLLKKHGLIGSPIFNGKKGIMDFIHQVGCIQFDPIDACGKNADLVLQSRIEGYQKEWLYELLYEERQLIDHFDKNMAIYPIEDWGYFTWIREHFASRHEEKSEIKEVESQIKSYLNENDFACSKDFDLDEKVSWYWSDTRLSRAALESLYYRGELLIHHKRGTIKYYGLIEKWMPSDVLSANPPHLTIDDYYVWAVLRRIRAVGMLWNGPSDAWLGIHKFKAGNRKNAFEMLVKTNQIVPIEVDGIKEPLYIDTFDIPLIESVLTSPKESAVVTNSMKNRLEFIAPLDNLIWDRKLISAIFDFEYKWEIYTPEVQRKYGYYVLPLLYGSQFVGRVEIVKNKKLNRMEVLNIWYEQGFKPKGEFKKAFRKKIKSFAKFNGFNEIMFEGF